MSDNIIIAMPPEVEFILHRLKNRGYEAYIVGGCVRDSLLCKSPKDWDICTSAEPEDVINIFEDKRVITTGLQHGTVTVMVNDVGYEVTTFRIDGEYTDNRRPDKVEFTDSLLTDLSRRDFTINAMAYSPETGLVDPFGGLDDLKNEVVRCVGNAEDRFKEDALRILRALRFSCQLNFTVYPTTVVAAYDQKSLLDNISKERICSEVSKMILCDNFSLKLCYYRNIFFQIIPELADMDGFDQHNPYHDHDVFVHTLYVLEYAPTDIVVRLAALFHDIGKPHCYQTDPDGTRHFRGHGKFSAMIAYEILQRLRFDADTIHQVVQLIHFHDATFAVGKQSVKRWLCKLGDVQFRRLIKLREADIRGQKRVVDDSRIEKLRSIEQDMNEILSTQQPFCIKDLNIDGNDLINIGYVQGPVIGYVLTQLLEAVITETIDNDKRSLIDLAEQWKPTILTGGHRHAEEKIK